MSFKNHARSAISLPYGSGDTTMQVADYSAFGPVPFRAWIVNGSYSNPALDPEFESVLVYDSNGSSTYTMIRGQEGTTAVAHNLTGATYYLVAGWTGEAANAATYGVHANVKEFGAIGDGTTDDRAAIQRAIDYVEAAGGGWVYLPVGTYYLATYNDATNRILLTAKDKVSIYGNGAQSSLKIGDGLNVGSGNHVHGVIFGRHEDGSVSNVVYRDFKVDGNSANNLIGFGESSGSKNAAIGIEDGTNIKVHGIYVLNNAGRQCLMFGYDFGNGLQTVIDLTIEGCLFRDVGAAASLGANTNQDDHSVIYASARNAVIRGNVMRNSVKPWESNNSLNASAIEGHLRNSVVHDNVVIGFRNGANNVATVTDSIDVNWHDNTFKEVNTALSIWSYTGRTTSGLKFKNNICEQEDFSVAENLVESGNVQSGTTFTDETIDGNTFRSLSTKTSQSPPPHTIEARYVDSLRVRNNRFEDLLGRAVSLSTINDGMELVITDNEIVDCGRTTVAANRQGIDLNQTAGTDISLMVITGNIIRNTSTIYMEAGIGGNCDISRGVVANNHFDNIATPYDFDGATQWIQYEPSFHVEDFGAVPDAATTNTTAIQSAINAASSIGGGVVFFGPGVYMSGSLIVKANVTLMGSGRAATTIKSIADLNDALLRLNEGDDNITIERLTADGNRTGYAGAPSPARSGCIRIVSNENVTIRNVIINDAMDDGIYMKLADTVNVSISDFKIFDADRQGIAIVGSEDVRIQDGLIHTTTNGGIHIEPADDAHHTNRIFISNVSIVEPGDHGISTSLNSVTTPGGNFQDIVISNCNVTDWGSVAEGNAYYLADFDNVTLTNCTAELVNSGLYSTSGHGIVAGAINFACVGYSISNCVIINPSLAGIYLVGGSGKVFSFPVVSNCVSYGANRKSSTAWSNLYISDYVEDPMVTGLKLDTVIGSGSLMSVGTTGVGDPQISPSHGYGADVASATTITLDGLWENYNITGSTSITTINGAWKGRTVTLHVPSTVTLTNSTGNMEIGSDFTPTGSGVIRLVYDGTNWRQITRSDN